jgi:hypothetical protein
MPQSLEQPATRPRKRGNPNWGKPPQPVPQIATEFELCTRRLGLTKRTYTASPRLRAWCEHNKNRFYIPEWLLTEWDIDTNCDAVVLSAPTKPRSKWG